jgi:hypothetical protein
MRILRCDEFLEDGSCLGVVCGSLRASGRPERCGEKERCGKRRNMSAP